LEYKTYKLISPAKLGKAMTQGWTPVASINFETGEMMETRFLIGKGAKAKTKAAGTTPVLMFSQPAADDAEASDENAEAAVKQILDRIADMEEDEVLMLHSELREQRGSAPVAEAEDEDAAVTEAMDELLGDDDGTEDDDE
jgi:hypothetical protein